mmetsp:Transcript_12773/g.24426  ORF Transcript_12773/g.24426 Transcript_12773/m.24426 type:complete len:158 (-) Transcript_12773:1291-1764(-)
MRLETIRLHVRHLLQVLFQLMLFIRCVVDIAGSFADTVAAGCTHRMPFGHPVGRAGNRSVEGGSLAVEEDNPQNPGQEDIAVGLADNSVLAVAAACLCSWNSGIQCWLGVGTKVFEGILLVLEDIQCSVDCNSRSYLRNWCNLTGMQNNLAAAGRKG